MKMNLYFLPNFTLSVHYKPLGSILKLSTKYVLKSYPHTLALRDFSDFFFLNLAAFDSIWWVFQNDQRTDSCFVI